MSKVMDPDDLVWFHYRTELNMDYIIFSDKHYRQKKIPKRLFDVIAHYCTTDDSQFRKSFSDDCTEDRKIKFGYIYLPFESDDYIEMYYYKEDGRPMGFIRKRYY